MGIDGAPASPSRGASGTEGVDSGPDFGAELEEVGERSELRDDAGDRHSSRKVDLRSVWRLPLRAAHAFARSWMFPHDSSEEMATSTCSLKPCLGCCEGHDSEERHDDGCDDTIIKAEHSSSLGFLNSEDPGTPQSDRLREWKEGETEQADVTGAEALDLSGVRIESDEVSHSTMSYLSVPPTSTTRRQSIVEVAGAATRQSRRPSMTEAWVAGDW
eukprot:g30525.t1